MSPLLDDDDAAADDVDVVDDAALAAIFDGAAGITTAGFDSFAVVDADAVVFGAGVSSSLSLSLPDGFGVAGLVGVTIEDRADAGIVCDAPDRPADGFGNEDTAVAAAAAGGDGDGVAAVFVTDGVDEGDGEATGDGVTTVGVVARFGGGGGICLAGAAGTDATLAGDDTIEVGATGVGVVDVTAADVGAGLTGVVLVVSTGTLVVLVAVGAGAGDDGVSSSGGGGRGGSSSSATGNIGAGIALVDAAGLLVTVAAEAAIDDNDAADDDDVVDGTTGGAATAIADGVAADDLAGGGGTLFGELEGNAAAVAATLAPTTPVADRVGDAAGGVVPTTAFLAATPAAFVVGTGVGVPLLGVDPVVDGIGRPLLLGRACVAALAATGVVAVAGVTDVTLPEPLAGRVGVAGPEVRNTPPVVDVTGTGGGRAAEVGVGVVVRGVDDSRAALAATRAAVDSADGADGNVVTTGTDAMGTLA